MEIVVKNNTLIKNESVYVNAHDKLINPEFKVKYTKTKKKILKQDELKLLPET